MTTKATMNDLAEAVQLLRGGTKLAIRAFLARVDPLGDNLGYRVRYQRQSRGQTLESLAGQAGMSKGQLSGIENGHHDPRSETIIRLSAALGVSCDYLLRGEAGPGEPTAMATSAMAEKGGK